MKGGTRRQKRHWYNATIKYSTMITTVFSRPVASARERQPSPNCKNFAACETFQRLFAYQKHLCELTRPNRPWALLRSWDYYCSTASRKIRTHLNHIPLLSIRPLKGGDIPLHDEHKPSYLHGIQSSSSMQFAQGQQYIVGGEKSSTSSSPGRPGCSEGFDALKFSVPYVNCSEGSDAFRFFFVNRNVRARARVNRHLLASIWFRVHQSDWSATNIDPT